MTKPKTGVPVIGTSLEDQSTRVSCLWYGREGSHKTTNLLRVSQLGRVLVINAEAGVKRQALIRQGVAVENVELWPPSPDMITFKALEELHGQILEALAADPNAYIAVGFDSQTEIANRLLEREMDRVVARAAAMSQDRSRWTIETDERVVISSQMRAILRMFRDLPVHLFSTALERRDTDKNSGNVSYGPGLTPAVQTDTLGLMDLVCFMRPESVGDEVFSVGHFREKDLHRAKDRFGLVPPKMILPSAERIIAYVEGELTLENDPERAKMIDAIHAAQTEAKAEAAAAPPDDSTESEGQPTEDQPAGADAD